MITFAFKRGLAVLCLLALSHSYAFSQLHDHQIHYSYNDSGERTGRYSLALMGKSKKGTFSDEDFCRYSFDASKQEFDICLNNVECPTNVTIYTVDGVVVNSFVMKESTAAIPFLNLRRGTYIVAICQNDRKMNVKVVKS